MDHSSEIILYLCIFVVKYVGLKKKGKSVSPKKKKKKKEEGKKHAHFAVSCSHLIKL